AREAECLAHHRATCEGACGAGVSCNATWGRPARSCDIGFPASHQAASRPRPGRAVARPAIEDEIHSRLAPRPRQDEGEPGENEDDVRAEEVRRGLPARGEE